MRDSRTIRVVLFFTRGMSLSVWDRVGMFDREVALYRRLSSHGMRVSFVTYGGRSELDYVDRLDGIEVLCNRWKLPARAYQLLVPVLHASHLRRAHLFKTNQTSGAEIALRASRLLSRPLVARCGYMWSTFESNKCGEGSYEARRAGRIEAEVFAAARRVVVTTPAMQDDVEARIPSAKGKVTVVPNYVETDRFCPNATRREAKTLVFVGRLEAQKNLSALLEAVSPMDVRLLIIGTGSMREELQQRFGTLHERVEWLGNVPNADLPHYLNRGCMFVLPSLYEGHPKALIEAMACGLPVIGAATPGIREIIEDRKNGLLCGTDSASMREAILELIDNPRLQEELGRHARRFAVENYSLDRVVELELDVLTGAAT